jgi:hypothetical protein
MVNPNRASGKVLFFPTPKQNAESAVENWIHRILETKDNLVSALELLRISYNAMLAGKPVREADEILAQVEGILQHGEAVKTNAILTATTVRGSSLPQAKHRPLLFFPIV